MSWRGTSDETIVHEAARTVAADTGCSFDDAIAKLCGHADALSKTVPDTAMLVIQGVIHLD